MKPTGGFTNEISLSQSAGNPMREGFDRLGREIAAKSAQRMCLDKKKFDSKNAARDHAKRGESLYGNEKTHSYKCSLCAGWHLTSLTKEQSAEARKRNWRKPDDKTRI